MKIIIAGSRGIEDFKLVKAAVEASPFNGKITQIVSGGAGGVDTLGEQWAAMNGIEIKQFKPNWNYLDHPDAMIKTNKFGKEYDAKAGFRRNGDMAKYADGLIAVFEGSETPGTDDMVKQMTETGKPLYVHGLAESKEKGDKKYRYYL